MIWLPIAPSTCTCSNASCVVRQVAGMKFPPVADADEVGGVAAELDDDVTVGDADAGVLDPLAAGECVLDEQPAATACAVITARTAVPERLIVHLSRRTPDRPSNDTPQLSRQTGLKVPRARGSRPADPTPASAPPSTELQPPPRHPRARLDHRYMGATKRAGAIGSVLLVSRVGPHPSRLVGIGPALLAPAVDHGLVRDQRLSKRGRLAVPPGV